MLYEFAMTPEIFDASVANTDNSAGVILIELLRGIAENGLLANLHKDRWLRYVTEKKATTLSPALKDKVFACLSVLDNRHRLVRHPKCMSGDPGTDMDWLNLALESHQRIPFHAIVLSQLMIDGCSQECDALVEFFGSLDSAQWNGRRRRSLTLTRSEAGYRQALAPILRYAKSLSLIDPYMNSHESRYFDTITICSNLMGQRGHARLQGRIYIHAEAGKQKPYDQQLPDYLNAWEHKLRPLVTNDGHRFKVFLWESIPGSESMHDRFILTDQCGISTPGGLDCRTHSHANSTDWSLLDEDVRLRRWSEYDAPVSPFNLLGDRDIS
ncbi:MAG: hypothetical protein JRJ86_13570 [Deltaproteobacteria bacterium]|nr:hypothetical protein [Deltaproteobacteria bacterium]